MDAGVGIANMPDTLNSTSAGGDGERVTYYRVKGFADYAFFNLHFVVINSDKSTATQSKTFTHLVLIFTYTLTLKLHIP